MENLEERLNEYTVRLQERGVVDIKFHRALGANFTREEYARDIMEVLDNYFAGNYTPFEGLGDGSKHRVK